MVALLLIAVAGALSGIYYLITLHIEEIVMTSYIKNEQIRSKAIAMLKQYHLSVTNSDLQG